MCIAKREQSHGFLGLVHPHQMRQDRGHPICQKAWNVDCKGFFSPPQDLVSLLIILWQLQQGRKNDCRCCYNRSLLTSLDEFDLFNSGAPNLAT